MASNYDTTSLKTFDNKVIAAKLESQLTTALDMNNYITTDYTLSANPGMSIEIHKYTGTGDVEDLAMGAGNTKDIGAGFTTETYTVGTTQGRVPYFDEQMMNDPTTVDKAIQHLSEQLTNDLTAKIVAELDKATNVKENVTFSYADFVDAVASMPFSETDNPNLVCLISKEDSATIQKNLKDDLKYVDDVVRTGYIGSVAGVPIRWCKAVKKGTAYICTKEAVTCFMKKGVEVSQERDENTRKTTIYGRNVKVVALTDDRKVVKLTAAK